MSIHPINPTMLRTWQAAVDELATHNGPLEVVPQTESGEELPRFRARLLRADAKDHSLILEKPTNLGPADALAKGVAVEVYLISGSTRMKAASRVIDLGWFTLNRQTKVMAARLEPVRDVASAQRRACFRLSTTALGMSATLTLQDEKDNTRFAAKVVDLSDRGLGVNATLGLEAAEKMKDRVFRAVVPLAGQDERLDLHARLVRVIENEAKTLTLGFQFEFVDLKEQRRVERTVQQFSVAQQRKQIKRLRGAG